MMKKLLIGLAVVVVIAIAAALAVPFLVPVDFYKGQIIARVRDATGRDLSINGPVRLSVLPSLAIEASDIAFANAPGAGAKDMATLGKLQVAIKLLPLLHGEFVVDHFVLVDPVIALEVDKQGHGNWVFAGTSTAPEHAPAKPGENKSAPSKGATTGLAQLRLDDVRLENGKFSYLDRRNGKRWEVSQVDMTLSLPSLDSPFHAEGSASWNGEKIQLTLAIANPRALEDGKSSALSAAVTAKPVKLDFRGEVANETPVKLDGIVDLQVPSVRNLARWLGSPIQMSGSGLGPLAIKGKLALAGAQVSFSEADLSLDAIKAKGDFAVDTGRARPFAKARLAVEKLDLNPYLPPEAPAAGGGATSTAPAGAPAKGGAWSDEPLNVAPLKSADAELQLSAGAIQYRKIAIGRSALAIHLENGRLAADLTELQLYQGNGQAKLVLDGSGAVPAIEANIKLAKVQAEPLLRDVAGFERLSGTAAYDLVATARGRSERELISALNGKGSLALANGAIKGLSLAAMVRNIKGAFLDSAADTPQQTDFGELGGTYTITNGILKNTDLTMKSPLLRVKGAGTANLPSRTVDYRITPELSATVEGQGGRDDAAGIAVPVLVQGPWDDLSYKPDLTGILHQLGEQPGKALDALKSVVPGLGGTTKPAPGTAPSTGSEQKPADVLKGLLPGK